jgi:hypothetical protein
MDTRESPKQSRDVNAPEKPTEGAHAEQFKGLYLSLA